MASTASSAQPDATPDAAALLGDGGATGRWTLDPQGSRVDFRVKHFWRAITVRGRFERFDGEGTVDPEGGITGRLSIDAATVNTKNARRDAHLRSADFFHTDAHPAIVVTVTQARLVGENRLAVQGELEAAGHREPITFTATVGDVSGQAVTLQAELVVDRTLFGMTWNPLRIAAHDATATVVARFTRAWP